MPMSGKTYVAPTRVDKSPPALDATELQAMCNTIVQNQGDASALQAAVQALSDRLNTLVITGTYIGNGAVGSESPTSIPLSGTPKFVSVMEKNDGINGGYIWVYNATKGAVSSGKYVNLTWSSNLLSWYTNSIYSADQLNAPGRSYSYVICY